MRDSWGTQNFTHLCDHRFLIFNANNLQYDLQWAIELGLSQHYKPKALLSQPSSLAT